MRRLSMRRRPSWSRGSWRRCEWRPNEPTAAAQTPRRKRGRQRTRCHWCGKALIMKVFRTPKATLGDLDADAVAELIAAATDIALIIDEAGVIQDVAITADDLMGDLRGHERWVGKLWADTVSGDSRPKAESLIADALSRKEPRWRHLNHPGAAGDDVPILYAAIQSGIPGSIVAFGRDMRAVSSLQRRLVDA